MDFEALRARADDIVTGAAASVTTAILEVVDDVLDAAVEAQGQMDARKANTAAGIWNVVVNTDGKSPEDIVRGVQEALEKFKQAKPAPSKTGGSQSTTKDELVRTIYNYLVENYSVYEGGSDAVREYIVNSSFEEDRIGLVQDLVEYLNRLPRSTGTDTTF